MQNANKLVESRAKVNKIVVVISVILDQKVVFKASYASMMYGYTMCIILIINFLPDSS